MRYAFLVRTSASARQWSERAYWVNGFADSADGSPTKEFARDSIMLEYEHVEENKKEQKRRWRWECTAEKMKKRENWPGWHARDDHDRHQYGGTPRRFRSRRNNSHRWLFSIRSRSSHLLWAFLVRRRARVEWPRWTLADRVQRQWVFPRFGLWRRYRFWIYRSHRSVVRSVPTKHKNITEHVRQESSFFMQLQDKQKFLWKVCSKFDVDLAGYWDSLLSIAEGDISDASSPMSNWPDLEPFAVDLSSTVAHSLRYGSISLYTTVLIRKEASFLRRRLMFSQTEREWTTIETTSLAQWIDTDVFCSGELWHSECMHTPDEEKTAGFQSVNIQKQLILQKACILACERMCKECEMYTPPWLNTTLQWREQ